MAKPMMPCNYCCFKTHFKPVTHILFDLDGTLLDTEDIYKNALSKVVKEYGGEYTDELHSSILGRIEIEVCTQIIKDLELDADVDEFRKKFQDESYGNLPNAKLMPGVEKFVNHMYEQEIPMAIGTSSTQESVDLKVSLKQEFFKKFHHIVSGSSDPEVLRGKPAPHVYLVAARRFPKIPRHDQILVFGDAFNDIKAGLAAGMQVVIIPDEILSWSYWKYATLRIDSFDDFIPELFGLPKYGSPLPEKKPKPESTEENPTNSDN